MSEEEQFDFESILKSMPSKYGVYRMLDGEGKVLYVGKARNLKSRVSSYFRSTGLTEKTLHLMARTRDVQVTILNSETEALLLEQTFIKKERPPYNVILRDDKSYPFIMFTDHEYPRMMLHRGSKRKKGQYFGPYPSAKATRDSIQILQKLFKLRTCDDYYFKNRSRPCLLYQIDRCSGPCVVDVAKKDYTDSVQFAELFLKGKSEDVLQSFKTSMNSASENLEFEKAAVLRDQITELVKVQQSQYVDTNSGSADVFGIAIEANYVCVQGMFIRDGRILGHRTWHTRDELGNEPGAVLSSFLAQFYLGGQVRDIPKEVITRFELSDGKTIQRALIELCGHQVLVSWQVITQRKQWLNLVQENAELALKTYMAKRTSIFERYLELQEILNLEEIPQRIECFDISHTQGEATVASCVVFDHEGPRSSDYRRFNIRTANERDDYGALAEAVTRHYTKLSENVANMPDILLIDGGPGQLGRVMDVLNELQIDSVKVLGISKGEGRRSEFDVLWSDRNQRVDISPNSGAMHLLQQARDEAHRFAITGHRNRRQKQRRRSELDSIDGIGPTRKRELLTHFGSVAAVKGASEEELRKVPGISKHLASEIFGVFHAN